MARNVRYMLIDAAGFIVSRHSVPERLLPSEIPEGKRIVVPADGVIPRERVKLDLRKVRKPVNFVASIEAVQTAWRDDDEVPTELQLEIVRGDAIEALDRAYAASIEAVRGPLAALHAEKRRQAERGPIDLTDTLIADEADRLAILANAAAEDEAVAAIERERREKKALIRAATTEDEIRAALVVTSDDPKAI